MFLNITHSFSVVLYCFGLTNSLPEYCSFCLRALLVLSKYYLFCMMMLLVLSKYYLGVLEKSHRLLLPEGVACTVKVLPILSEDAACTVKVLPLLLSASKYAVKAPKILRESLIKVPTL